jgi:hypothetical protein
MTLNVCLSAASRGLQQAVPRASARVDEREPNTLSNSASTAAGCRIKSWHETVRQRHPTSAPASATWPRCWGPERAGKVASTGPARRFAVGLHPNWIASSVKNASVDVWTGTGDRALHKRPDLDFDSGSTAAPARQHSVSRPQADLSVLRPQQPQTISAPANVKPFGGFGKLRGIFSSSAARGSACRARAAAELTPATSRVQQLHSPGRRQRRQTAAAPLLSGGGGLRPPLSSPAPGGRPRARPLPRLPLFVLGRRRVMVWPLQRSSRWCSSIGVSSEISTSRRPRTPPC